MKLIRLEILNLASLDNTGGEVIDFEKGALADTSIFSIVGPTGSGKSTLLDAICLALYNRAPRYPRKKGDRNQGIEVYGAPDDGERNRPAPTDGRNILTRGKKKGHSKVTFLANNGIVYRAEWHVERKTKNFTDPVTLLYQLSPSGDGYDEKLVEWTSLPHIIGLDYEQFLRTVLIAQGSFANFLTAKEDERYLLLEKLVGCRDTYTAVADSIRSRREEARMRVDELGAGLQASRQYLLDDERLLQLRETIARLEQEERKIAARIAEIDKSLGWYASEEAELKTLLEFKRKADISRATLAGLREKITSLDTRDAALPAIDLAAECERLAREVSTVDSEIARMASEIESKNAELERQSGIMRKLETAVADSRAAAEAAHPVILTARDLISKIGEREAALAEKKRQRKKARTEKNAADKAAEANAREIADSESALRKSEANLAAALELQESRRKELAQIESEAVEALEAAKAKTAETDSHMLMIRKDNAVSGLNDLESAIETLGDIARWTDEIGKGTARMEALAERDAELKDKRAAKDIDAMRARVDTLRQMHTLITSENWSVHRHLLTEGDACPLCGATLHPYASQPGLLDEHSSALRHEIDEKEAALKQLVEEDSAMAAELARNEGELRQLEESLGKHRSALAERKEKWARIAARHATWTGDIEALEASRPAFSREREAAEAELERHNQARAEVDRLTEAAGNAHKARSEYEEKATGMVETERSSRDAARDALTACTARKEGLAVRQTEKTAALDSLTAECELGDKEIARLRDELKQIMDGKDPDAEEKRLDKEVREAETSLTDKKKEIDSINTAVSQLTGALAARRGQRDDANTLRDTKIQELGRWIEEYNAEHTDQLSEESVADMLHSPCDWQALRREIDDARGAVTSSEALEADAAKRHDEFLSKRPDVSADDLQAEKSGLTDSSVRAELVSANAALQNHLRAAAELGDRKEAYDLAAKALADWEEITQAVGPDGKLLRKIAQCYTLAFLIDHANSEIRKFNRRYELVQVKNSLGIRVIDHDRADDIRDTTSLSGGETFIVSLGLALGLSSLSSRNISFDNLFIDEGFGTLDPDTLATVIDSLAMLHSSQGKKVGVISHTDVMSERITTQIRVVKNGNTGSSHIEIYPD